MPGRYEFARPRTEEAPAYGPWGPRLPPRSIFITVLLLSVFVPLYGYAGWKGWDFGFAEPPHLSPAAAGLPVYPDAYNFTSGALTRASFRDLGSFEQRYLYDVPNGRAEDILTFYERKLLPLHWKPAGAVVHDDGLDNSHLDFRQEDTGRLMEVRVFYLETAPHVAKVLISSPYAAWQR